MIEFFQTRMGQIFFEGTMPALVRQLDRLNKNLEASHTSAADGSATSAKTVIAPVRPHGSWQVTRAGWILSLRIEWMREPRAVVQVGSYRLFAAIAEKLVGVEADINTAEVSMGGSGYVTRLDVEVSDDEQAEAARGVLEQAAVQMLRA